MRKKCVRWTKSVRVPLIVALAIVGAFAVAPRAQSTNPSTLPLLSAESFRYLGGFRLPRETVNGDNFNYGGRPAAFSPSTNSLFVGSRAGRLAEVTIPVPVITSDVTKMPFATYLQPFSDPTEGRLSQVATGGVAIDGLMVYGDRLYGTASVYYDATNSQRLSHYSRSLQLNQLSFSGWSQVWDTGKAGFVSGFLTTVPAEWQNALGGPAATGQCCVPIVSRTSWGPAALAFNPSEVGQAAVPAMPMLYYTGEHPTLGPWSGSNPTYGATIAMGGMALVGGTRTALFVGRNGTGPYCYGSGTGDPSLAGTPSPDGSPWCYDPTSGDKGPHAYPYRYQIWAYDLNDFAAVRAGTKQPWEVVPYGVWPFELPTFEKMVRIGGVTYDAERRLLYVTQMGADKDGYSSRPIIHVFELDIPAPPPPPPPPAPIDAVTLSVDKPAPQMTNTTMTFTAAPSGGVEPYEYQWLVHDGTAWTAAGAWSASNTFSWTPATANSNYEVAVWARSSWNTTDTGEATTAMAFPVMEPAPAVKVASASLASNLASPQTTGTTITWTATAVGGGAPLQYKWWVYDGVNWIIYRHWSASNVFGWTPGTASSAYKVAVWVKSSTNTKDEAEASFSSAAFTISGKAVVVPPPPSQTSVKVLAVQIAPSLPAPQKVGTTITWTATATGGSGVLYKWWVFNGSNWTVLTGWSTSPSFAWTPAAPNAKYKIAVWAKSGTTTADAAEASTSFDYLVNGTKQ